MVKKVDQTQIQSDYIRGRIREVIDGGFSAFAWATSAGLSEGTIRNFLTGQNKTIRMSTLGDLAEASNRSVEWFLPPSKGTQARGDSQAQTIADSAHQSQYQSAPRLESIPVYDVRASSGFTAWNDDEVIVGHHSYQLNWLRKIGASPPEQLAVITNVGDSNVPLIKAGDKLLVDLGKTKPLDGRFYAIRYDGSLVVKQVELVPGGELIVLKSVASAPREAKLSDLEIVGEVIDRSGSLL